MSFINVIIQDVLAQPAFILGLIAFIGLLASKRPLSQLITGTFKPILGYLILMAGAEVILTNLEPLGLMMEEGFQVTGVVPNNEAIAALAQNILGKETMYIFVIGLIFNIIIARFTRFKYIFLTGHHILFMAIFFSAFLSNQGFSGFPLILVGGLFLGAWMSLSPAIGQRYTRRVANGESLALGHFNSLCIYLSAWLGERFGKADHSIEDMEIPKNLEFLRETTISTAITMMVFYTIASVAAGKDFVEGLSGGTHYLVYAIMLSLKFAVGVAIVFYGIQMILGDLIPAFEGISKKIIPNSIPAVDSAVLFTYAPTAVVVGFVVSFIGGILGMLALGAMGMVVIIPGLVAHFFTGGSAGIYGNATGGRRGAILGSFINGLGITFLPALLLPEIGELGQHGTTFGDIDFAVIGILLGRVGAFFGGIGIYVVLVMVILFLFLGRRHAIEP